MSWPTWSKHDFFIWRLNGGDKRMEDFKVQCSIHKMDIQAVRPGHTLQWQQGLCICPPLPIWHKSLSLWEWKKDDISGCFPFSLWAAGNKLLLLPVIHPGSSGHYMCLCVLWPETKLISDAFKKRLLESGTIAIAAGGMLGCVAHAMAHSGSCNTEWFMDRGCTRMYVCKKIRA